MTQYLADTSIWVWARRIDRLREKLGKRIAAGEVATCVPVALEHLHSSRNGVEYDEDLDDLRRLHRLPLTAAAAERALELQRSLAHTTHGAHRIPTVDYLVAGIAVEAGATLWHADGHLARLCDLAGHPHEHEPLRED